MTAPLKHTYQGDCPDDTQPDSRDPECPACAALMQAGAAIDAQQAAPVRAPTLQQWEKHQAEGNPLHTYATNLTGAQPLPARATTVFLQPAPPAVQAPVVLTDADIERLMLPWAKEEGPWHEYERNDLIAGVRAVLAAAGAAAQGGEHE